jgi:hypothetical protein
MDLKQVTVMSSPPKPDPMSGEPVIVAKFILIYCLSTAFIHLTNTTLDDTCNTNVAAYPKLDVLI